MAQAAGSFSLDLLAKVLKRKRQDPRYRADLMQGKPHIFKLTEQAETFHYQ